MRPSRLEPCISMFSSSFIIKYQFTLTSYIYGTKTQRGRDRRQTANGHGHLQYLDEWKTRFTTMPRHVKMVVAAAATGVRAARDKRVLETVMRLASRASYRYVLCLYILLCLFNTASCIYGIKKTRRFDMSKEQWQQQQRE